MRIIFSRDDGGEYLFLRPGAPLNRSGHDEESEFVQFSSRRMAASLLHRLGRDAADLSALRSLLPPHPGLTRLGDHAALNHLATLVWRGTIAVRRRCVRRAYFVETPAASVAAAQPPPTPRPSAVEESDTFSPDHDALAQAMGLKAAAEAGVPFCEECAKLR